MRFVDHDQTRVGGQCGQHIVAKLRIVQPLRTHQQHVEFTGGDLSVDRIPLGDVARVDGGCVHAGALGGRDLIAHQRQQWRHDHGGTPALLAQKFGGDEVHRRLAPSGALHNQRPTAGHHECLDGGPLVLAQHRVRPGELFQDRLCAFASAHRTIVHPARLRASPLGL